MVPDLAVLNHQVAQEEHVNHAKRSAACLGLHRLGADLVGARVSKVWEVHAMMQLSVQDAAAAAVAKVPAVPRAGAVTRAGADSRAVAVRAVYSKAQEAVPSQLVCQRSSAEQGSDLGSVCKSQRQQQQLQSCCCLWHCQCPSDEDHGQTSELRLSVCKCVMFPWEGFCTWKKKIAAAGSVCQARELIFLLLKTQPYQSHFDCVAILTPLLFFLLLTWVTHDGAWGF